LNLTVVATVNFTVGTAIASGKKQGPWHMECTRHAVDRAGAVPIVNFTVRLELYSTWQCELQGGDIDAVRRKKHLGQWHMECTLV
jgi:hypothetical protein